MSPESTVQSPESKPGTRRFAFSHHTGSPEGDHYDLFIEAGEALRTWRIPATNFRSPQQATRTPDHRKTYLDYEGEISGGRGAVTIWDRGACIIDAESEQHLRVALHGAKVQTRLRLDRTPADSATPDAWTLSDPTLLVRRRLSTHLRSPLLAIPEPAELLVLHEELFAWESRLAPPAQRFISGREVDWTALEWDALLIPKIRALYSRWRHSWLAQAFRFARRLEHARQLMLGYRSLDNR